MPLVVHAGMVPHSVVAVKLPRGAILLIVAGGFGAVACVSGFLLADGADGRVGDYPGVDAGSMATLELEAGEQVGWFESTCFGCEGRESSVPAPDLRVVGPVMSTQGEAPVEPHDDQGAARYSPGDFLNYSDGPRDGGPAYDVDVPADGSYTVTVGPSSEPDASIRIGPSTETEKVGGVVLAVAGFLLAGGALFVLAAWWIAVMLRDATRNG
jgi:hypothetical protein